MICPVFLRFFLRGEKQVFYSGTPVNYLTALKNPAEISAGFVSLILQARVITPSTYVARVEQPPFACAARLKAAVFNRREAVDAPRLRSSDHLCANYPSIKRGKQGATIDTHYFSNADLLRLGVCVDSAIAERMSRIDCRTRIHVCEVRKIRAVCRRRDAGGIPPAIQTRDNAMIPEGYVALYQIAGGMRRFFAIAGCSGKNILFIT